MHLIPELIRSELDMINFLYIGTILYTFMIHADKLIIQMKDSASKVRNKLVDLWYKRINNYIYKYSQP